MSPPNVKNCSSPLSASSTAATIFVACTSRPTRVLAFDMAGSSYAVVDRRAVPAARLNRHPTTLAGDRPPLHPGPNGTQSILSSAAFPGRSGCSRGWPRGCWSRGETGARHLAPTEPPAGFPLTGPHEDRTRAPSAWSLAGSASALRRIAYAATARCGSRRPSGLPLAATGSTGDGAERRPMAVATRGTLWPRVPRAPGRQALHLRLPGSSSREPSSVRASTPSPRASRRGAYRLGGLREGEARGREQIVGGRAD